MQIYVVQYIPLLAHGPLQHQGDAVVAEFQCPQIGSSSLDLWLTILQRGA